MNLKAPISRRPRFARWPERVVVLCLTAALLLLVTPTPSYAVSHEQINGYGSSWAFNAVNQWVSDVQQSGVHVTFTPNGSAAGRQYFAQGGNVSDFAISDIGYQGVNPVTGAQDTSNRAYAYLPMVAGGTAFPYNIVVGGQRVMNLRLSGLTLAKIFTDQITNWDDPEITTDNNGRQLPSIPIIPVIHSEGAGTSYQFSDYLFTEFPSLWENFTKQATQGKAYDFPTEYWPTGAGSQVAENGSDGVINFVNSSAGQGSIGFDEYSYAIFAGLPVAAIENSAGYFTMPDAYDVAVSLTQAQINEDKSSQNYLLETLNNVYTYNDPRTYPVSSYSYMIEPTAPGDPTVSTTGKAQSLADFINWSICKGQAEMVPIGYSPLPINLVQASYQQLGILHQANPAVDISSENIAQCGNPTFIPNQPDTNYLAEIAPMPPACAKAGQGPCAGQYAHNGNPVNGHAGGGGGGGTTATSHATTGGSGGSGPSANGSSLSAVASSGAVVTGVSTSSSGSSSDTTAPAALFATPTELAADHAPTGVVTILTEVLVAVALPAGLALPPYLRRRRGRR